MLVLSRKSRESVVVGGSDGFHRLMKVTVLAIKGSNVKLGFEVGADVPVQFFQGPAGTSWDSAKRHSTASPLRRFR